MLLRKKSEKKDEIYQLFFKLIDNPFAPKNYRELAKRYDGNDTDAFLYALTVKFGIDEIDIV